MARIALPPGARRFRCPVCRVGRIELVVDGAVGQQYVPRGVIVIGHELPWRWRWVPFGACNSCEFCLTIDVSLRPDLERTPTQKRRAVE